MGPVTFREALARSLNVPTVKILNSITAQTGIDHISHFGFDKKQFQPYLTLSLGANEVTPLQLAEAYAVFANGGYLVNPYIISSITDDSGNVLAKTAVVDIKNESTVIDPRNAYIINSILQDSVRYGTGAAVYRALKRNDLAGKTGTTSDNKDVWFNGYTPNLVAITWVGYDLPKTLGSRAYGASVSLPIWIDFMRSALPQIPEIQLPMPSGIAVLQNVTWKGNDEYLYMNASYIPQLPDNQANEESATDADLTNTDATDQSGNNETQNTESKTNDSALDNLIKNLF
jgi:penicillin-binding protein 1A